MPVERARITEADIGGLLLIAAISTHAPPEAVPDIPHRRAAA